MTQFTDQQEIVFQDKLTRAISLAKKAGFEVSNPAHDPEGKGHIRELQMDGVKVGCIRPADPNGVADAGPMVHLSAEF